MLIRKEFTKIFLQYGNVFSFDPKIYKQQLILEINFNINIS